jgi:uncharacterized protein (TIGR00255 family)
MPIRSMTGFGIAEAKTPSGNYHIEIRGVNNRFLDLQLRLPRTFLNLEQKIKKEISQTISRGSVSVFISTDKEDAPLHLTWEKEAVENYVRIFREIKKTFSLSGDITLTDLLHFSDVIKTKTIAYDDKTLLKHIGPALDIALENYRKSRETEGAFIEKDLKKNLDDVLKNLKSIERRAPQRVTEFSKELSVKIEKLLDRTSGKVDEARLATEVALMADRLDVSEECTRLRAHIAAFVADFKQNEPVGKRMNFLLQEMNREATTIGSKANDIEVSHLSIKIKESIEKIREQIQNIE